MGSTGMLGFAIAFCFVALILVCLGFATDHWVDVTVNRANVKTLIGNTQITNTDPNTFTRSRGVFKVCYDGSETLFLDGNPDVVSGNCLWITGLTMASDENSINYEDEYEWRNHIIRAHLACTIIGMVALLAGVILASIGCWQLKPRGFRLAGLIVFIGAFFVACGMGCFHGYDYLEREKINQKQQGLFPLYWMNQSILKNESLLNYGWSYIISWVGMGLAAIAAVLLLCTAYNVQFDDDYNKYSEKKLEKKLKRKTQPVSQPPSGYGPPPVYADTPVPSMMGPSPPVYGPPVYGPPVYGQAPGPAQVVEVPVEVPVAVPVEPPQVIPVMEAAYGYNDGYSAYGGGYGGGGSYGGGYGGYKGYGGYVDEMPIFGPAGYGETDRYWM